MKTSDPYDVILVGAGPVGLFLACELALGRCRVLVLEQADSPDHPLKELPFGLRGLSAPTLEALHRRGLLEALQAGQPAPGSAGTAHWSRQGQRPGGHFAGIQFAQDAVDASAWPWRLPSPAGTSMAVTMAALERVLAMRADALGVEIRRGACVESLACSDAGVVVRMQDGFAQADWLVGCDGGRSMVRKAGGFAVSGTEPEFTGYSLQVEGIGAGELAPGRHYTPMGMVTFQAPGTIAMVDFDGGAGHRRPVTLDHAQAVLRRVSGVPGTLTGLTLATTWTDRALQATAYRRGRVLLAGDAAHIHAPLGGQGLNLGLGDAMNLGWKLAATIRGDAPAGLLDSYQAERHSVGASVLDWSRAQVALMRPTPATRALEAIMRDLIATGDGATYMAGRIWGVTQRYDLGQGHSLAGRSAPDFALPDGSCVGEMLRSGIGLLLDFDDCPRRRAWAAPWEGRITYAAGAARDRLGLGAVLIRPDGIVAWACDEGEDDQTLAQAASQWFG
jgi:2-polyprenyl-6-methoxyphenol hydroxylase-like FAD-dependent oxidoreductase